MGSKNIDDLEGFKGEIEEPDLHKTRDRIAKYLLWGLLGMLVLHYGVTVLFTCIFNCDPIVTRIGAGKDIEEINVLKSALEICVQTKRDNLATIEKIFTTWFGAMIAVFGSAVAFFYSRSE